MEKSWLPTVAGVLSILAGVPTLLVSLLLVAATGLFAFAPEPGIPREWLQGLVLLVAAFVFLCAAVAILGGTLAIRGSHFGWALAGAIAATVCLPPLGVAAIVLVVLAEKELRCQRATAAG